MDPPATADPEIGISLLRVRDSRSIAQADPVLTDVTYVLHSLALTAAGGWAANVKKTGFDKYFDHQMRDPRMRAAYEASRARIAMIDGLVRALDEARQEQGLTKAELARRIGAEPAAIRRLLTTPEPNPTMATFVSAAQALGLEINVTPMRRASRSDGRRVQGRRASA